MKIKELVENRGKETNFVEKNDDPLLRKTNVEYLKNVLLLLVVVKGCDREEGEKWHSVSVVRNTAKCGAEGRDQREQFAHEKMEVCESYLCVTVMSERVKLSVKLSSWVRFLLILGIKKKGENETNHWMS